VQPATEPLSQSIRTHFDGERILLDEPVQLEPNTGLIVTVLSAEDSDHNFVLTVSRKRLEVAYEKPKKNIL
jgi:hypothetical protein